MGSTHNPKDAEMIYRLQRRPDMIEVADVARLIELALAEKRAGFRDPTEHTCSECGTVFYTFGHTHRKTCGAADCRTERNREKARDWAANNKDIL